MVAFFRLAVFGLVALTAVYLIVLAYAGSLRREALEREWDERQGPGLREDFLAEGMRRWRHGFRHRLILLVYVVPVLTVAALVYWLNFT